MHSVLAWMRQVVTSRYISGALYQVLVKRDGVVRHDAVPRLTRRLFTAVS